MDNFNQPDSLPVDNSPEVDQEQVKEDCVATLRQFLKSGDSGKPHLQKRRIADLRICYHRKSPDQQNYKNNNIVTEQKIDSLAND